MVNTFKGATMKNKILILLLLMLCIGIMDISKTYAAGQLVLIATTSQSNCYLDTSSITVTKDEDNRVYYDTWLIFENKQAIQELKFSTNQYEPAKRKINHIVFIIAPDKKIAETWSIASYTNSGNVINSYTPLEPKISNIEDKTLGDTVIKYISNMHIDPIAIKNEKYLPINKKDFFDLFEARGYRFNQINEGQKYNPFHGTNYTAFSTPYSFYDKVIEKEVHLSVAGEDNQCLNRAHIQFALEGPNYEQSDKSLNLPSEEKLNLLYMMLEVLFPDWPKEESKKWIDDSIATMNEKNSLMFIYLHKDREYIMISRQPVQKDEVVQYVLSVSQQKPPGFVNPYYPYYEDERSHVFHVYQEWKSLQNSPK